MAKLLRLYQTLRDLKFIQLFFQLRYRLSIPILVKFNFEKNYEVLSNFEFLESRECCGYNNTFSFLNEKIKFKEEINWNYLNNGLLWNYNLNYFDFINNKETPNRQYLITSYFKNYHSIQAGKDPYPTSLRIINLIKYVVSENNYNNELIDIIYWDTRNLLKWREYHLLGNHLLENAMALYFAAHLFKSHELRILSIQLLTEELNEQILSDGAHFELSPMYHQIILNRLLECISITNKNKQQWNKEVNKFIYKKVELMANWLYTISDNFKYFIRINDSIEGIAPQLTELRDYLNLLNIPFKNGSTLKDSKIRIIKDLNYFLLFDTSDIVSKYQAGHSHADSLNFLLFVQGKPLIVDPGISTYEPNKQRLSERSTKHHNTISINNLNNDDVWGSFRVGFKSKTKFLVDSANHIEVSNNGYRKLGVSISREIITDRTIIQVIDKIAAKKDNEATINLHFHPDYRIDLVSTNKVIIKNLAEIIFTGFKKIEKCQYYYAEGFNKRTIAEKLTITFEKEILTQIRINE